MLKHTNYVNRIGQRADIAKILRDDPETAIWSPIRIPDSDHSNLIYEDGSCTIYQMKWTCDEKKNTERN